MRAAGRAVGGHEPEDEIMLFHTVYRYRSAEEAAAERRLRLFQNWQPPQGFEMQAAYTFADASGGVNIVESDSAAAIVKAAAVIAPDLDFDITPLASTEDGAAAFEEAIAFHASVQ